jgi:ABC-type Na+ efflux pump permease subunit
MRAVIHLEWLLRARREQFRALLSCYGLFLFLDCNALYIRVVLGPDGIFLSPAPGQSGRFIAAGVQFLWLQQWLMPFVLAPPFVASAFEMEKANRVLPLLFTTTFTSGEIILGKFLARAFPLVLLSLAYMPFWGLFVGLLGLDPLSAGILATASLLPILATSAASLVASVWCRTTADAVVALYIAFAAGILGVWLLGLENAVPPLCPNYLLEPIWDGWRGLPELGRRALSATAVWGSIVVGCLGLASWRLRSQAAERPVIRGGRLSSRRPAVDDEPIRWKECYRERRLPLAMVRCIPTWLVLFGVFVGTAHLYFSSLLPSEVTIGDLVDCVRTGEFQALGHQLRSKAQASGPAIGLASSMGLGMILLTALTVGVRCATAITGERECGTWELLLLTPLSTRELIAGKVRGILRSNRTYLAVYALAAVPLAWLAGQGELLVTLLTLLLVGPVMWAAGAAGIYHSARAANSWRSILSTVGLIISGALHIALVSNFVVGFIGLIFYGLTGLFDNPASSLPLLDWFGMERRYQSAFCFLSALVALWSACCWQVGRDRLQKTEKWIDDSERARCCEIQKRNKAQAGASAFSAAKTVS